MNYLAHAVLSFQQPDILTGNMISDFVKGRNQYTFPVNIQKGIQLHRAIDTFTDSHPSTREAKQLLKPASGGYAGPFIDIVFDHFLSLDAAEIPSEGWEVFSQSVYVHLESQSALLPETFKKILPYMKQHNWLANYHHIHSIEKSFQGIARRAKFLEDALPAFRLFESEYLLLQKIYADFFPELKEFAQTRMQELSAV